MQQSSPLRRKPSSLATDPTLVSKIDGLHAEVQAVYAELRDKDFDHLLNTPLPNFVQPWFFGLFVPPPVWDPVTRNNVRITLVGCLRYALALGGLLIVLCGGLGILFMGLVLMLIPLLPLIALLGPPVLFIGGVVYLYTRRASKPTAALASSHFSSELATAHAMRDASDVLSRVDCTAGDGAERRQSFTSSSSSLSSWQDANWRGRLGERLSEQLKARLPSVIGGAAVRQPASFNEHVREATSLAVYGCGILASAHVGGLRALEQRGLDYARLTTLAGVSAGSVVVALLAVGYTSTTLLEQVMAMPFHLLPQPELGALLRGAGNLLITLLSKVRRAGQARRALRETFEGNGPGVNSGRVLEELIATALENAPGADAARARGIVMRDITLGEVLDVFGKRLVIIVTELDTGRERRLSPDVIHGRTDRHLPVRVAVRMSMGVPGLFEPFSYQNHVYVDGGMTNDFPMNALPDDGHRIGLMVRPARWMKAHLGAFDTKIGRWLAREGKKSGGDDDGGGGGPGLQEMPLAKRMPSSTQPRELREWARAWLQRSDEAAMADASSRSSIYPVRDCLQLMETCMQTMSTQIPRPLSNQKSLHPPALWSLSDLLPVRSPLPYLLTANGIGAPRTVDANLILQIREAARAGGGAGGSRDGHAWAGGGDDDAGIASPKRAPEASMTELPVLTPAPAGTPAGTSAGREVASKGGQPEVEVGSSSREAESADEPTPGTAHVDSDGGDSEAEREAGDDAKRRSVFNLAPQILTLSGGSYSPFDFALRKEDHRTLYLAGQLSVHLAAAEKEGGGMSEEDKVRALRYLMRMGEEGQGE